MSGLIRIQTVCHSDSILESFLGFFFREKYPRMTKKYERFPRKQNNIILLMMLQMKINAKKV